nr:uncharacterized protein LOC108943157 [Nicotiana tomentosiformis]
MPEDILSLSKKKGAQMPIKKEAITIPTQEEDADFLGYSNLYHFEMWGNSGTNEDGGLNFNLTIQSTVTEVVAIYTDSVAEVGVVVCAEVTPAIKKKSRVYRK